MEKRYREALSEIYEILLYIDQKSFDEIPLEVIFKITENKSKEYSFKINEKENELGEIIENKISEETKEILAYLYLKYWSDTEKDENLKKELLALEETMKLQGIYEIFTLDMTNPIIQDIKDEDIINDEISDNKENKAIMKQEKENIFIKLKNILMRFFKRFGKKKEENL